MEWIKAKDKLPEHRQRVILFPEKYKIITAVFLMDFSNKNFDYKNVFISDDNVEYHHLTHPQNNYRWMPLPEPPK